MRPGAIGVREIRGPHIVLFTEELAGHGTNRVILKRHHHLATDIHARLHRQRLVRHDVKFLIGMIEPIEIMRKPAAVIFRGHQQELRETL